MISNSFINSLFGQPVLFGLAQIFELFSNLIQTIPAFMNSPFTSVLRQQLLPLHLSTEYSTYASPFLSSLLILLERDPPVVNDFIMFLLHHFPSASQRKQIMFLDEIATVVQRLWESMSPRTTRILFSRLSFLFSSTCAEISEKSLGLIFCPGFGQLIKQYYLALAPFLLNSAVLVSKFHWNDGSRSSAFSFLQELSRLDQQNFPKVKSRIGKSSEETRTAMWESLKDAGPAKSESQNEPQITTARSAGIPATAAGGRNVAKLRGVPIRLKSGQK
jgi:hypothetical protein